MNGIIPHIPAFIDVDHPEKAYFNTLDELLKIDFIARHNNKRLLRFSIYRTKEKPILMKEMKDGKYWVIGYLDKDIEELPTFIPY